MVKLCKLQISVRYSSIHCYGTNHTKHAAIGCYILWSQELHTSNVFYDFIGSAIYNGTGSYKCIKQQNQL